MNNRVADMNFHLTKIQLKCFKLRYHRRPLHSLALWCQRPADGEKRNRQTWAEYLSSDDENKIVLTQPRFIWRN